MSGAHRGGRLSRGLRLALTGALVAALVPAIPGPVRAAVLPERFRDRVVFSGLTQPTAVRFSPDGRVFVAEKSGLVQVFDGFGDSTPTVFADLRTNVYSFWDRGLLGMALAPGFPTDPYVYVLYTHDFDPAVPADVPRWGTAGETADPCPSPPGPTTDGCVVSGRLSRLRAAGDVMSGPEEVLIDDWCQQYPSHSVGTLAFGTDGALYASAGEGAAFTRVDYGQDGDPVNPCGDPPVGAGGTPTPPTAEGGALRSQDLRTAGDPTSLDGTIIRVDPATGAALPDNPGLGDATARRIVAYGLRNPFRFSFRPGTDELWIGDVGWHRREEINRLQGPTSVPVENFAWPCYEGSEPQPGYDAADLDVCESMYRESVDVPPYHAYDHLAPVVPGDPCPTGSSSISGLAFYQGGPYPDAYDGALFFADYSRDCIWVMHPGAGGLPDPQNLVTFVADAANPVDLQIGPDGDLFYVDFDGGTIRRITYYPGNQPPTAIATADPTSGAAPLTVSFDGSASGDPDPGDTLTFAWDLDGDGQFDDASVPMPTRTYGPGAYSVRLRVTDPQGEADTSDPIAITANDTAPTMIIDAPAPATSWAVGDTIGFAGHAEDAQDGALPPSALSWTLDIQHCPSSCHQHPVQSFPEVASGSFVAPDHEYPSHLQLSVTATDSGGLTDTESVLLDPRTVALWFGSSPPGADLTVDDTSQGAPFSRTVIEGSRHSVSAVESLPGPPGHWFDRWSDGGARTHDIVAPPSGDSYVASYVLNRPPSAAAEATPSAGPAPLDVSLTAAGSSDPDPADGIASFAWDLDGDGLFDDSTSPGPSRTYEMGSHTVRLMVTDRLGMTDVDELTVTALNAPPAVTIDSPQASTTWAVGDTIALSGRATDPQDGSLAGSALVWSVELCNPLSCTLRYRGTGLNSSFIAPDAAYPSWIEVGLTATDSGGLAGTATTLVFPRTVRLTFRTVPLAGIWLSVDDRRQRAPFSRRVIAGSRHALWAPARIDPAGPVRFFAGWSDGGGRAHAIVADDAERYVATYRRRG